jgi:hypothetical protein
VPPRARLRPSERAALTGALVPIDRAGHEGAAATVVVASRWAAPVGMVIATAVAVAGAAYHWIRGRRRRSSGSR